jgi:adenosylcobinamide-phosphate synthase
LRDGAAPLLLVTCAWHLPTGLIALAVAFDAIAGDPAWMPHPVRLVGKAITTGESRLWSGSPLQDLRRGALLASAITFAAIAGVWILIASASILAPAAGAAVAVIMAWTTVALRGLDGAAATVQRALEAEDLCAARAVLPALVGRDPQSLDRAGIIRATVESVAENSSDGVIAPLFYLFVGGPAAAMAYKAINTLDSMLGHTDRRYLYFGRWAARMDDFANLIPARLSAGCLVAAAALLRLHPLDAIRVCRADARRHPSPNAGFPEAAMAGALGIQLGGTAIYGGEIEARPLLGAAHREANTTDIAAARRMLWVQSLIAFGLMAAARLMLKPLWAG